MPSNNGASFESFQRELEQVLDRHRELLGAHTGYTIGVALHALEAERARYDVDIESIENAGPDGVWFVHFEDDGGAMLGLVGHPEKRSEVDIDVAELDLGQSAGWSHQSTPPRGGRR